MNRVINRRPPSEAAAFASLDQSPLAQAARSTRAPATRPDDNGWDEIINQLIDISQLGDDWDGEGSPAPDRGVVSGATKLASVLRADNKPPAGRVTASVNGTICFEWHSPEGYQEIEVESPVYAEQHWVATGAKVAEVTPIVIE